MNIFNIRRAFKLFYTRKYRKMYWKIDVHDTIFVGKFDKENKDKEFFPDAKEVLQWLSDNPKMCIILWSSAHEEATRKIADWLGENGIKVDYLGENPEVPNNHLCDFSKKIAFDILLDDKAGFEGETDWGLIKKELKAIGEFNDGKA
jgi:hypothetical protein